MATTDVTFVNQTVSKQVIDTSKSSYSNESVLKGDGIEKRALWLRSKLKEGPIDGPSSVRTYREEVRQILFQEFRSPVSDLEISVVVRKAFPRHSRRGKYFLGIGTSSSAKHADKAGQAIATGDPKSLMHIQSDSESRESSPVMLKPVKKRAIQAWKKTENGLAFAADQMIRDANNPVPSPIVQVSTNDGVLHSPWQQPLLLQLPHHRLPMAAPHGMLFAPGSLPTIPNHTVMTTSKPSIVHSLPVSSTSKGRRRPMAVDPNVTFPKMRYEMSSERPRKKSKKDGFMIDLSSSSASHNGLIAERTNMAAMHIKPIILDFDVPLPKLPLTQLASDSSQGVAVDSSGRLRGHDVPQDGPLNVQQAQAADRMLHSPPQPGDGVNGSQANRDDSLSKLLTMSSNSRMSADDFEKSTNPFKKPDIESYRTNVSAGRCFMCQNPIPPNVHRDVPPTMAEIGICMKCKKVAMSGSNTFKPVPKFPYACNPKLAPRTVYVPPPRRTRPRPSPPTGPPKAVGIRLYPPRSRNKTSTSQRPLSGVPSPGAPPRSPGQLSMPNSPASSLALGSPRPESPALMTQSAPPSPRRASDVGARLTAHSLPPSPSMIAPHHPASPVAPDSGELDPSQRPVHSSASLQVPSPGYSSNSSTPEGRETLERLSLPPGREQDDATIKALLQLGRSSEEPTSTDCAMASSPISRTNERDLTLPSQTAACSIPHVTMPHIVLSANQPGLAGQIPSCMIPSNTGLVMGPDGQLLPIVPSWPPMGNEVMGTISPAIYPQLFIPAATVPGETQSPRMSPAHLDFASSTSRTPMDSTSVSRVGSSSDTHGYDILQLKYQKGLKSSRFSTDGRTASPSGNYRTNAGHDAIKTQKPIVIMGTNCAGASSVKVNREAKETPLYHHQPRSTTREASGMYGGKPFGAFCCRCTGRDVVMLQCPDCDFLCNNKYGLELHIAAQRHAETHHGNKTASPKTMTRHAHDEDDRDDIASQSSLETQSADTETDVTSPPPTTRVAWEPSWLRPTDANLPPFPHPSWHGKPWQFIPSGRGTDAETTVGGPSLSLSQSGVESRNDKPVVPLDLSGRLFLPHHYFPDVSTAGSFQSLTMRDLSKYSSRSEASSPLDLSGYNRSPILPSMPRYISERKPRDDAPIPPKKILFDEMFTKKSSSEPTPPQTYLDPMNLQNVPVPSLSCTVNPFKNSSPVVHQSKTVRQPPVNLSTIPVDSTDVHYAASPITPSIPSIVLSSGTVPSVGRLPHQGPVTGLTRAPPSLMTLMGQPQFLNYQGGTISVRHSVPTIQSHVLSRTVPVLSPFLPSAAKTGGGSAEKYFSGRAPCSVASQNASSPDSRESPKVQTVYGACENSSVDSIRRELSPVPSPHSFHVKIEPPESPDEISPGRERIDRWKEETHRQAHLLDAAQSPSDNHRVSTSESCRAAWSTASKSLRIDETLTSTTPASLSLTSTSINTSDTRSTPVSSSQRIYSNNGLQNAHRLESATGGCTDARLVVENQSDTSREGTPNTVPRSSPLGKSASSPVHEANNNASPSMLPDASDASCSPGGLQIKEED